MGAPTVGQPRIDNGEGRRAGKYAELWEVNSYRWQMMHYVFAHFEAGDYFSPQVIADMCTEAIAHGAKLPRLFTDAVRVAGELGDLASKRVVIKVKKTEVVFNPKTITYRAKGHTWWRLGSAEGKRLLVGNGGVFTPAIHAALGVEEGYVACSGCGATIKEREVAAFWGIRPPKPHKQQKFNRRDYCRLCHEQIDRFSRTLKDEGI